MDGKESKAVGALANYERKDMLTGININETKPYYSVQDKAEPKTKFTIGVLDSYAKAYIEDQTVFYDRAPDGTPISRIRFSERAWLIVKFGLRSVENFIDARSGHPVVIDPENFNIGNQLYRVVPGEVLKIIPEEILSELAAVIWEANTLKADEEKN